METSDAERRRSFTGVLRKGNGGRCFLPWFSIYRRLEGLQQCKLCAWSTRFEMPRYRDIPLQIGCKPSLNLWEGFEAVPHFVRR